jgi:hypothetical protein
MPQANPLAQIAQLQQLDLQNQALQQGQANLGRTAGQRHQQYARDADHQA